MARASYEFCHVISTEVAQSISGVSTCKYVAVSVYQEIVYLPLDLQTANHTGHAGNFGEGRQREGCMRDV